MHSIVVRRDDQPRAVFIGETPVGVGATDRIVRRSGLATDRRRIKPVIERIE
ncbi:MAG: hypothetical protein IIB61_02880 [Planctomycetes bacterium]|nr:hypothetical protein [Planctomycetota bacterium]